MVKNIDNTEVVETAVTPTEGTLMCYLVTEGGEYFVETLDGVRGEACKIDKNNAICLTPNPANRRWWNRTKADKQFETTDKIELTYKATRVLGSIGPKLPNEKLISYLPEAEQEEYRAIIARAILARDAEKNKPMTEAEKKAKRLAKLKAELEALEAEIANNSTVEA